MNYAYSSSDGLYEKALLSHPPRVSNMCFSKSGQRCLRKWLGAKPLSKAMLDHCQLDPWKQTSVTL